MPIKMGFYIALAITLYGGGNWVYGLWKNYQTLKFEQQMTFQNQRALEDSLFVLAGKQTIITSQVRDLTVENQELKGKTVALTIKTRVLADSLRRHGRDTTAIITDSSASVKFSGKEKFANFSGWTSANLKTPTLSTWGLDLWFDEITTKAILFKDFDDLWKLKTISLTDGINIHGISVLDDNTFAALQKYSPPVPPKNFGIQFQGNTSDIWGGIIFRYNDRWYFNTNYRVINSQSKWFENLLIGTSYFVW
jgi:hypothetical protein